MNIIDPEVKFDPNTMKLIHCPACDRTWAAKKIPAVCPFCGKPKGKNGISTASEDECMSYGEEYGELMAKRMQEQPEAEDNADGSDSESDYGSADRYGGQYPDGYDSDMYSDFGEDAASDNQESQGLQSQDTDSYEYADTDSYEPIGYDPDELANNMNGKKKVGKLVQKQLIAQAENEIKETKRAVQRAGLPTDAFQNIVPEVRSKADSLGGYIPDYASILLKMTVDSTIQMELRHPRKGRRYTISDVNEMLSELDINENYWESYYSVAGLM